MSGLPGGRSLFAYNASKHAVIGMTKVGAVELFLASDAASFVTGTAIPVDGGLKAQ